MSKETLNETIKTIQGLDGMKAVKVAFELSQSNMESVTKIAEVVGLVDKNLKLLATKVLELEKKVESLEGYANREF